jgi:hypothetical protein
MKEVRASMDARHRDIIGAALALLGAGYAGMLLLLGTSSGLGWKLLVGLFVLAVIIDNLWLLLGKERLTSRSVRSRRD